MSSLPGRTSPGDREGPATAVNVAALLELVLTTPSVEDYLDEVATMAGGLTPAIAGCGITVRRGPDVLSVATSNELAAAVDEVQYGLGRGPCLETLATGQVIDVPDMAQEDRWGSYPGHALGFGVRSSLSLPIGVAGTTPGALNCYGLEAHLFTGDLRARVVEFATHAELALAVAFRSAEQSQLLEQLHTAMQSRSIIDQALGILMGRQRCTSEEAFAMLRSASQSRNRKVTDIAAEIISATTGREPRPGRFQS